MATNQDVLMKKSTIGGPTRSSSPERRGSRRCKITQLMRIRPSDPEKEPFEDLRGTVSVSRSGIYFHTTELGYELGMRLFVTMPYSYNPSAMSREYLAEVVRKDPMPNGMTGIGFKTLLEMSEQPSYSFGVANSRK
jgi:PilZ domain